MHLYFSSSCIKERSLYRNLAHWKSLGIHNVELTGGLIYDVNNLNWIKEFSEQKEMQIQLHNYSPPVKKDFVLNLASLTNKTYDLSFEHVESTLKVVNNQNLGKYAVHAGFYIPILENELGKRIKKRSLYDRKQCMTQFVNSMNKLYQVGGEDLYVENNVLSKANYSEYGENPFMFTNLDEYLELKSMIPDLKILVDLAHLKVSCQTLGLNFEKQAHALLQFTDYIHISDNDGTADTNEGLTAKSRIYAVLKETKLQGKTVTLEVYSGFDDVLRSRDLMKELV